MRKTGTNITLGTHTSCGASELAPFRSKALVRGQSGPTQALAGLLSNGKALRSAWSTMSIKTFQKALFCGFWQGFASVYRSIYLGTSQKVNDIDFSFLLTTGSIWANFRMLGEYTSLQSGHCGFLELLRFHQLLFVVTVVIASTLVRTVRFGFYYLRTLGDKRRQMSTYWLPAVYSLHCLALLPRGPLV